jgi:diaminopimelate decarboxylase
LIINKTVFRYRREFKMIKMEENDFIKIKNDGNGNPRYAIHFLRFCNDRDGTPISEQYQNVLNLSKKLKLGGHKFQNKQYGGGWVFQSYNLGHTVIFLNEKINAYYEGLK